MGSKYWLDLFTGKTWEEFLKSGATVSGFRERRRNIAKNIEVGDYLICYLTGIMRFVGVLEVKSKAYYDKSPLWEEDEFPVRFKVKLLHRLEPDTAVPIRELSDRLRLFNNLKSPNAWTGLFRGSPARFDESDGRIVVDAIKKAIDQPISREFDDKKYWRHPKTFESTKIGPVTVPEEDTPEDETHEKNRGREKETHEEIQYLLLKLGSDLGMTVWVARNDKGGGYDGKPFKEIPGLRKDIPRQFDEASNRTVELIDVLWLQDDAIVAAFEVEHTSAIYSGLLRMADLVTLQPNIKLDLYLVAPDERRDKVLSEINRPTFAKLKPSLPIICRFIPYSKLKKEVEALGSRVRHLKPEFIADIAETCVVESA